jgi:nitrogen fixation NifU-like protein
MNAEERIIEHYKHPRRRGALAAPTVRERDVNPFCGDEVTIELLLEGDRVVDAAFEGRGCSLSQATASMLLEEIVGKSTAEIRNWGSAEVFAMLGIEIGPVRQKCALLPLNVLHACVADRPSPEQNDVNTNQFNTEE